MKKQEKNTTNPLLMSDGSRTLSRVLLVVAIIIYSMSLVLLANLALAAGSATTKGALIKVNNQLDGEAFGRLQPDVKSFSGNILSINVDEATFKKLQQVKGVCNAQLDHKPSGSASHLNFELSKNKYAGANIVVGILDNSGLVSQSNLAALQKLEPLSNVGFISYKNSDNNSTVIITNLIGGESNLVQALLYMHKYAKTVNKPLAIELILSGNELNNPLFVQVCQSFVELGVQFVNGGKPVVFPENDSHMQFAFTMFNAATKQLSDKTDFWALSEVKNQQLMLLGSDQKTCSITFETESGFDKVYLSNNSNDIVTVTSLSPNGQVNYFHVASKETALIPRELKNGAPFLADGLDGVYPFLSKNALFNGSLSKGQFVFLNKQNVSVPLNAESGMKMTVGSPTEHTLAMSLTDLDAELEIEIKRADGTTVYLKKPDAETKSIQTKIALSDDVDALYYLDLTSPNFQQSVVLKMN